MALFTIKFTRIFFVTLICFAVSAYASDFPQWMDQSTFSSDLRAAARISNLPNPGGGEHYLGLTSSLAMVSAESGENIVIPGVRIAIYPNPGYNLWTRFARWPGSEPVFSVGTGIQVEFPGEQQAVRQAIGLTWNKVFGNGYTQRDISAHALYGRSNRSFDYGLIAILDLHHIIVEGNHEIADYNETIFKAVPYISWMVMSQSKLTLNLPLDSQGLALELSFEWVLGPRD